MKILFAVNNDNISDAIVKKYQKEYKEILSYKNVYYFNAILRELQKDKSYNRIVISEDLEPFANNNYTTIDNFLFEKYKNISEVAKDVNNDPIDIIIICADRRKKTDNMLTKIYNNGIYNAIIGHDRSIDEICRLINTPRDKEEAIAYYGIYQSELSDTQTEESVSEGEVENIIAHYARLGRNEEKYVESFNNIVSQYNDAQLKIIIKYLPINVKAVLEAKSPKYQQLVMSSRETNFNAKKQTSKYKEQLKKKNLKSEEKDEIVQQLIKTKNIKTVVIPSAIKEIKHENVQKEEKTENIIENNKEIVISEPVEEKNIEEQPKRGRGRPRKYPLPIEDESKPKRGRGRPRKNQLEETDIKENKEIDVLNLETQIPEVKKPEVDLFNMDTEIPKVQKPVLNELNLSAINKKDDELFNFEEELNKENNEEFDLFNIDEIAEPEEDEGIDLFNIDETTELEEDDGIDLSNIIETTEPEEDEEIDLFNIEETAEPKEDEEIDLFNIEETAEPEEDEGVDLFNIEETTDPEEDEGVELFNIEETTDPEEDEGVDLFNIEETTEPEEDEEVDLFSIEETTEPEEDEGVDLFNIEETAEPEEDEEVDLFNIKETANTNESKQDFNKKIVQTTYSNVNSNIAITADKKIVAFVGTTKNGTSFIVNNTAEMLASMGIDTAILDMTKTKNAYYIYTNNDEELRTIARDCMENLQNGLPKGIKINKNLTVYTEMPGEEKEYEIDTILQTLLNTYSAVLIDTDFETSYEVFENVQELYLVQTMDVLTIQPLTAFLRNLKSANILKPERLKIVVNKFEKVRSLNIKTLIGGMSCYNSPNMTYMTELFNRDNIPYCEIPFEVQNYVKYLDSLVNCSISLNGYTKQFIASLRKLANMVYPLVNKQINNKKERHEPFSSQVNETLNKMKNKH